MQLVKKSEGNKNHIWIFTTPEELRELAINIERQASVSKLGESLVAYEKKIGENDILRIALRQ